MPGDGEGDAGGKGQPTGPGPPASILKMARPAPGSLAARSSAKLSFLKRAAAASASSPKPPQRASSVGEVTIEVEVPPSSLSSRTPPKASPLVDYDTGPSASPSLTISPTSSPRPGTAASSCSNSPHANNFGFGSNASPGSSSGKAAGGTASRADTAEAEDEIEVVSEEEPPSKAPPPPASLVTVASTTSSPLLPPPHVVLRRKGSGGSPQEQRSSSNSNSNSTPSTLALSARDPLTYNRISRQLQQRASAAEVGRMLKEALDAHFSSKANGKSAGTSDQSSLDDYVREVFGQLDYHRCGSISREDFETLCEVLGMSASPPPSHRNSGIEWLSSYRPRDTHSPLSPLKVDRLGEVKYRAAEGSAREGIGEETG